MADFLHYFDDNTDFERVYNGASYEDPWASATLVSGEKRKSGAKYRANYNKPKSQSKQKENEKEKQI